MSFMMSGAFILVGVSPEALCETDTSNTSAEQAQTITRLAPKRSKCVKTVFGRLRITS
jgi:hypothetical protein